MKPDDKNPALPGYEYIQDEINWTEGAGRPAGLYWLNGRSQFAAHGSAAELRLRELGWVLIATLRYEADILETSPRGRTVARVASPDMTGAFLASGAS